MQIRGKMRLSRLLFVAVAVFAITSCRIVLTQDLSDSPESELRAEQDVIACELAGNASLSEQFKSAVRERHGVSPGYGRSHVHYLSTTVDYESVCDACEVD